MDIAQLLNDVMTMGNWPTIVAASIIVYLLCAAAISVARKVVRWRTRVKEDTQFHNRLRDCRQEYRQQQTQQEVPAETITVEETATPQRTAKPAEPIQQAQPIQETSSTAHMTFNDDTGPKRAESDGGVLDVIVLRDFFNDRDDDGMERIHEPTKDRDKEVSEAISIRDYLKDNKKSSEPSDPASSTIHLEQDANAPSADGEPSLGVEPETEEGLSAEIAIDFVVEEVELEEVEIFAETADEDNHFDETESQSAEFHSFPDTSEESFEPIVEIELLEEDSIEIELPNQLISEIDIAEDAGGNSAECDSAVYMGPAIDLNAFREAAENGEATIAPANGEASGEGTVDENTNGADEWDPRFGRKVEPAANRNLANGEVSSIELTSEERAILIAISRQRLDGVSRSGLISSQRVELALIRLMETGLIDAVDDQFVNSPAGQRWLELEDAS